ncbi:SDR family NAD(P)-dependent oxidoreductase [Halodesulfovibrio spirochaetisodalis]|uniref:SDR family NAD(P)-dependent oxidoreductase n=1 Tax=Halodesulfovibrio spirochaetisodalis TaxID=1560234 RepID=UPI000836769A|nr:SDR family oxidoreductase [Halodesulfovibrio spirochaetisodalis]
MADIPIHLSGTHACILGASSDLGMAIAHTLADAGIELTLSACSEQGINRITLAFPAATILKLDMKEIAQYAMTDRASELDGIDSPDYLIDCMQTDFEAFIAGAESSDVTSYMETNISGRAACLRHISRMMLGKRFGRCIFISSTAAALPNAGQGFYSASKLAGEALYRSLGVELGKRGVTSCSVRLGYVQSGRGTDFLEKNPQTTGRIPMARAVTAQEAARSIAFLLSDDAQMINSTTITMDGGLTACK